MKFYVVKNCIVVFSGTEEECIEVIAEDLSGELEMYPEEGRAKCVIVKIVCGQYGTMQECML